MAYQLLFSQDLGEPCLMKHDIGRRKNGLTRKASEAHRLYTPIVRNLLVERVTGL
jgi:hypothetical protein